MAHFAQINSSGTVLRVVVVPHDQEHRGQAYLKTDLGLGGKWVQTSFNGTIRRRFAGIGMTYNKDLDVFVEQQPFFSWSLDENGDWQAPIPMPSDPGFWNWDEEQGIWADQSEN